MTTVLPCQVYRIYVWDPRTGYRTKTLGYIGETLRLPVVRLLEHIADDSKHANRDAGDEAKPWADTFAGYDMDPRMFASKAEVQAAEEAAVKAERPLYNVEFNGDNPHRITPAEQSRQRRERDRSGWARTRAVPHSVVPTSRRVAAPPRRRPARARRREPDYDLPDFLFRWLGYLAVWAVVTGGVWWAMCTGTDACTAGGLRTGAVTATVGHVLVLLFRGPKRRRRNGNRRRSR